MDGYGLVTQNNIHNWVMVKGTTPPGEIKYCMLSTSKFYNDANGMAEVLVENPPATDTGYDRIAVPATSWDSAHQPLDDDYATESTNANAEIRWDVSEQAWGLITSFALMVNSTPVVGEDPDIYFGGNLDTPKQIDADTVAVFAPGNLKLRTINSVNL